MNLKYALLLFLLPTFLFSQEKDQGKWTPKDIINTERMSNVKIAPNNEMVVWTKRKPVKEKDKFVSDIYLTLLKKKDENGFKTIQLTNKDENDHSPFFSKDSEYVYFLSSREKGKKLWKLNVYGGEPIEVNEFKNGISNIQWKDENTLLYISTEGKTLRENQFKEKKDDVVVVEDTLYWKPSRIYSYNLKTKKITRLTNNLKPIETYVVSPNGKWLVYTESRNISFAADAQKDPFVFLKNLDTGTTTKINNTTNTPFGNFKFTEDGKGFYFLASLTSDPEWNGAGISELYYYNIQQNNYTKVPLNWDLGIGRGYNVIGNDVLATLANKATYKLMYYKKNGNTWKQLPIDLNEKNNHTLVLATAKSKNKIIYTYSTASKLPTYYIASLKENKISKEEEIIKLNKSLQKKRITKSEVMTWHGYNNDEVTGILYYPENYIEGKTYPLILSIHGGPSGVDTDMWSERWSTYPNILAQRGAFVLCPNYHGSSNHGLEFVESIKGNYYEPEMEDISKAIAILVEKGMVNPNMLGTTGWSNGAILTTMLTLKFPDKFKVAAAGAGDVNWTSDYGTCSFGVSFDQSYFGGAPWDDTNGKFYNENYILKSPLFEIEKIKTPTIIFHGSEDRAVPRDQGWEYYRGLQQVGKAPVRFLWFPGQPHGLQKISHQLRKMNEELKWIDTYLFNKKDEENVAFKKDSPLGEIITLEKAKKSEHLYGELFQDKLIPETVSIKKDSIEIGKFEVTNAQYKAFNEAYKFPETKANYPVLVNKKEAELYVAWLSKITGENYRLPNKSEATNLHKKALKNAKNQNNLNYWAGYSITYDEIADFKQKLYSISASLIKEVGSFKAIKVGEATIYDLGGNVAEHFVEGKYDYSAYDFYDDKSEDTKSNFVGIRVIKE